MSSASSSSSSCSSSTTFSSLAMRSFCCNNNCLRRWRNITVFDSAMTGKRAGVLFRLKISEAVSASFQSLEGGETKTEGGRGEREGGGRRLKSV